MGFLLVINFAKDMHYNFRATSHVDIVRTEWGTYAVDDKDSNLRQTISGAANFSISSHAI